MLHEVISCMITKLPSFREQYSFLFKMGSAHEPSGLRYCRDKKDVRATPKNNSVNDLFTLKTYLCTRSIYPFELGSLL